MKVIVQLFFFLVIVIFVIGKNILKIVDDFGFFVDDFDLVLFFVEVENDFDRVFFDIILIDFDFLYDEENDFGSG